ncbi:hypothetical protein [Halobacillus sp. A5]|uniref:YphA family membrane protein n=1 Tax=Halobacillus sp. A5 TaxID=2880263 RepID=UPI0020A66BF0|nr:hypothetical protein [Halobacillus sp. A5]MCP3025844.1 hypothetical protein [Halobacillus sp. A5]
MAVYYWYAWFIVIIILFFLTSRKYKKTALLTFVLLQMIFLPFIHMDVFLWTSLVIQCFFGIYLWAEPRPIFQQLWPVLFTFCWAVFQLFLLSNPVWYLFPGVQIAIVGVLIIFHYLTFTFNSQLGLWLIMNILGVITAGIVSDILFLDFMPDYVNVHTTVLQGIVVIFILNGISYLKRSSAKLKRNKKALVYR